MRVIIIGGGWAGTAAAIAARKAGAEVCLIGCWDVAMQVESCVTTVGSRLPKR